MVPETVSGGGRSNDYACALCGGRERWSGVCVWDGGALLPVCVACDEGEGESPPLLPGEPTPLPLDADLRGGTDDQGAGDEGPADVLQAVADCLWTLALDRRYRAGDDD